MSLYKNLNFDNQLTELPSSFAAVLPKGNASTLGTKYNLKSNGEEVEQDPIQISRWMSMVHLDKDFMEICSTESVQKVLDNSKDQWGRSFSNYILRDGRGGCASLALNSEVGEIITLAHPDMTRAFAVGDYIISFNRDLYLSTPKRQKALSNLQTRLVVEVDHQLGTLKLDSPFSGIGKAGDIIGHRTAQNQNTMFGNLYGLFTYLDTDHTMPVGTPTQYALEYIQSICDRDRLKIDLILTGTEEWTDLARILSQKRKIVANPSKQTLEVVGFEKELPYSTATVLCDPYLWDLSSTDRLFVALVHEEWSFLTNDIGIGWQLRGNANDQQLVDSTGMGDLTGRYGALGQLVTKNPTAIVVRIKR